MYHRYHAERHAFALRFLGILTSYGFGYSYRGWGLPVAQRLWPYIAFVYKWESGEGIMLGSWARCPMAAAKQSDAHSDRMEVPIRNSLLL